MKYGYFCWPSKSNDQWKDFQFLIYYAHCERGSFISKYVYRFGFYNIVYSNYLSVIYESNAWLKIVFNISEHLIDRPQELEHVPILFRYKVHYASYWQQQNWPLSYNKWAEITYGLEGVITYLTIGNFAMKTYSEVIIISSKGFALIES